MKFFNTARGFHKKLASFGEYLLEVLIYACFISGYFFLVLHSLNGFVKPVFDYHRTLYALLALALIFMQGFALERLTSGISHVVHRTGAFISVLIRLFRPHETIRTPANVAGLLIYRFAGPLFFFNAGHFARRVQELIDTAGFPVTFFLINAEAIVDADITGADVLADLRGSLKERNIMMGLCEVKGHFREVLFDMDVLADFTVYPSVVAALRALGKEQPETKKKSEVS